MTKRIEFHGINTREWTHAADTGIEPRMLRHMVSKFNDEFGTSEDQKYYILSGAQGYRMTRNLEEIEKQIMRDYKRAKREMKRVTDRNSNLAYMQAMKLHGGEL